MSAVVRATKPGCRFCGNKESIPDPADRRQEQIDKQIYCIYNKSMKIEFDQAKSEKNSQERKLPFDLAVYFEWESALVWEDCRREYGEKRFCAIGYIKNRIYHIAFTLRGEAIRIISLRKANNREVNKYADT